jgi:hypothetical protein
MILENHIVSKILTKNDDFAVEIIMSQAESDGKDLTGPEGQKNLDSYIDMIYLLKNDNNKNYYITKSVIEKLELFDTKRCMQIEGWSIFKGLPDFKKTYLLPDPDKSYAKYGGSGFLRVIKVGDILQFFHCTAKFLPPQERTRTIDSSLYFVVLFVDLGRGIMADHWQSNDGKSLAPFLYSLMCFVELCDNQTVEILPKQKYGTKKTGKIINTLPFPITVINNTWNVTTIRTEGFPVCGHAAIYWTGPGRTIPRLLYREPYMKQGYTRRSGKELHIQ